MPWSVVGWGKPHPTKTPFMTSQNQTPISGTPVAILAERARAAPHEPWLFHRDGWDWRWLSWSRAADQVARGAAVLRGAVAGGSAVAYAARQHPDAVAAGLAIQAAGMVSVPVSGEPEAGADAWAEVEGAAGQGRVTGAARVVLPAALSPLDRTRLLELDSEAAAGAVRLPDRGEPAPAASIRAAERLAGALPPAARRAIVCASPDLDPAAAHLLEAWTLVRAAAWVLEPQGSALLETVLWARPTQVWGRPGELARLGSRMAERKHRRHSRLSAVVAAGGGVVDPDPWQALGVEVVSLGEDPLAARPTVGEV